MLDTFEAGSGGRWRYLQKDQSGMEEGLNDSSERLTELLETI